MWNSLRRFLKADSATELARFGIVGASGVLVNNAVLFLLHGALGWHLILASVVAVETAIVNNFIWNDMWTFSERTPARFRFLRFNLVSLGGLVVNTGALAGIVALTGVHYLVANLVAIGVAMAWNFSANARWTWLRDIETSRTPAASISRGDLMTDDMVVVPTYNEAANIETLIRRVLDQGPFGVLVVDDGSPDGTGKIVHRLAKDCPGRVSLLQRPGKDGLGSAYRSGFEYALARKPERIYQMDADLSHDPAVLPALRTALMSGNDLAIGSRYVAGGGVVGWPWWRKVLSRGGSLYAATLLGLRQKDLTGGYKGWRRETLEAIRSEETRSNGYAFQIETTYRATVAGADVVEVPITFADREHGKSKMGWPIILEAVRIVPGLRLRGPTLDSATFEPKFAHPGSATEAGTGTQIQVDVGLAEEPSESQDL